MVPAARLLTGLSKDKWRNKPGAVRTALILARLNATSSTGINQTSSQGCGVAGGISVPP